MKTDIATNSPAGAGSSPSSCSGGEGRPKFELHRYNPRRAARGAEASEVKVTWPDGEEEYLWMSKRDINANMKEWGACDGLLDALNAYRQNGRRELPPLTNQKGQDGT
jgi:hypothetical protein